MISFDWTFSEIQPWEMYKYFIQRSTLLCCVVTWVYAVYALQRTTENIEKKIFSILFRYQFCVCTDIIDAQMLRISIAHHTPYTYPHKSAEKCIRWFYIIIIKSTIYLFVWMLLYVLLLLFIFMLLLLLSLSTYTYLYLCCGKRQKNGSHVWTDIIYFLVSEWMFICLFISTFSWYSWMCVYVRTFTSLHLYMFSNSMCRYAYVIYVAFMSCETELIRPIEKENKIKFIVLCMHFFPSCILNQKHFNKIHTHRLHTPSVFPFIKIVSSKFHRKKILKCFFSLSNSKLLLINSIYIYTINQNQNHSLHEPCLGCAAPYGFHNAMPLSTDTSIFAVSSIR